MHVFCPDCNAEYKVNERSSLTKTVKFVCVECGQSWVDKFEKLEKTKEAAPAPQESIEDGVIEKKNKKLETMELNSLAYEEVQNSFGSQKNTIESANNNTEREHTFQFETSEVKNEIGKEGPSRSFPNIKDNLENHSDNRIEERDAKEIAIEKRLKESSDLLKKAKQPNIENKETTQKGNRPKSRTVLVTLSIFLVASFFSYNLFILFLDEILREIPFAQEILSQINLYATSFKDILSVFLERIMNFISNLG
ncbi:hypothetical protein OA340_02080 [Paracoccaceae bacterium]|nr:hypothetical protein [Paracoccaceae bacterium]